MSKWQEYQKEGNFYYKLLHIISSEYQKEGIINKIKKICHNTREQEKPGQKQISNYNIQKNLLKIEVKPRKSVQVRRKIHWLKTYSSYTKVKIF